MRDNENAKMIEHISFYILTSSLLFLIRITELKYLPHSILNLESIKIEDIVNAISTRRQVNTSSLRKAN